MMEIIKTNENTKVNTGSVELDKAINIVYDEMRRGNKAAHTIAIQFHTISTKKLYEYTGAKSFSDFAENYFGISRSQATRLVKIADKFLIGDNASKYEQYNNTQLIEMLSAPDEMLEYIKPTMKASEIRKYISDGKKLLEDNSENEGETDNNETPDNTPDNISDNTPDNVPETKSSVEIVEKTETTPKLIKGRKFTITCMDNGDMHHAIIEDTYGLHELSLYLLENNVELKNLRIDFKF